MGRVSLPTALRRACTAGATLLCIIAAHAPAASQTVRGRLIDAQTGKPVAAAEMYLLAGTSGNRVAKHGLTTDSGSFTFAAGAGRYRLRAERIGYRPVVSRPFDLVASQGLEVKLEISSQAVPLAPLTVVSHRPALLSSIRLVTSGFFDREQKWGTQGLGLGTFIDKQAIERRQPTRVTDLLRAVPGVRIESIGGDRAVVRMHTVTTLRGNCTPTIYIDGIPLRTTGDTMVDNSNRIDDLISPSSIAAIEVYSSLSKPGQFMDMGTEPCGALVIWTGYSGTGDRRAGAGGGAAGAAGGTSLELGERPRHNKSTATAQRLLEQADSVDNADSGAAARSFYEQALNVAHVAIAEDSTNPLPRLQAGEAAIGAGDYKEADKQLRVAGRLRPLYQLRTQSIRQKAWAALQRQAAPLVSAGRYQQAIPLYEDANVIDRERPEVMLLLGQLYAQEGKDDRALANLDSAAAIIQDSAKLASVDSATAADWRARLQATQATRAALLTHAGRYDEAVVAYRKVVQRRPHEVSAQMSLAQLLIKTRKYPEAKRTYDGMLQDTALSASYLYQIGMDFYRMADFAGAVRGFSGAARKRPKDRDALEMWTRSLAMGSAYAQVSPVAQQWMALDPNNPRVYILEAQVLGQQGDDQRSRELVKRVQDLDVTVTHLNIDRPPEGGATVTGTLTDKKLAGGAKVTITFTFYDHRGDALGTQSRTVAMGGQGRAQTFTIHFDSDAKVGGYGYTLTTS